MKFLSMVHPNTSSDQMVGDYSSHKARPQALSFGSPEELVDEQLPPAAPRLGPKANLEIENMEEISNLPSAASTDLASSHHYGVSTNMPLGFAGMQG